MITPQYIKKLVEVSSGINNLESKSRKRELVDARFVCYKLCKDFIPYRKFTLSSVGYVFNRNHATVIHGINEFNNLFNSNSFKSSKNLYLHVKSELMKSNKLYNDNELSNELTIEEIKQIYKLKHINHVNKSQEVISVLNKRIEKIKNNLPIYYNSESLQRLSELNYKDFKEFEKRADLYIKSLNWKSKVK